MSGDRSYSFSLPEILAELSGRVEVLGETEQKVVGIASLEEAQVGDLSFLGNSKYGKQLLATRASVVFVPWETPGSPAEDQVWLQVENPSYALALICGVIDRQLQPKVVAGVHASAIVPDSVQLGEGVSIGAQAVLGESCVIGDGVQIGPQVAIGHFAELGEGTCIRARAVVADGSVLGKYVLLQSGCVIGSDGYGYDFHEGRHQKIPHIGRVVLEDYVEVGANTTLDRGRFKETRIGEGTKIDNLVQIAHNVQVGKHCLIVAQAGISGSTQLGDFVIVGGQVGMVGHIKVGSFSKIGAQAGVNHDLEEKSYVTGTPAMPFMMMQKVYALQRKLPEFTKRLRALEVAASLG